MLHCLHFSDIWSQFSDLQTQNTSGDNTGNGVGIPHATQENVSVSNILQIIDILGTELQRV
jgi:hypothetical protein